MRPKLPCKAQITGISTQVNYLYNDDLSSKTPKTRTKRKQLMPHYKSRADFLKKNPRATAYAALASATQQQQKMT